MLFSDHYRALASYIRLESPADAQLINRVIKPAEPVDQKAIRALLLNSWSAEYALRITPVVNDEQYLQSSLHWTFPQAYYSVLFSSRAFLAVQGINVSNEELIRKRITNMVTAAYYPFSLGFYGLGLHNSLGIHRLSPTVPLLKDFINETRLNRLTTFFRANQLNPKTAFRRPVSGSILDNFSDAGLEQLKGIVRRVGYTTYFDLMSRLRISSTNRDIEKLDLGELNVRSFHADLVEIVTHINSVHECYIAQVLGVDAYRELVAALPSYLKESFVRERLTHVVLPNVWNLHASHIEPVQ